MDEELYKNSLKYSENNSHSNIYLIIDEILRYNMLEGIYDQYGNHVIQKIIEKIPYKEISFIQEHIEKNGKDLGMDTFGGRVIQRIIEFCPDIGTDPIYDIIVNNDVIDLCKDQFGNYVVQLVLEKGHRPCDRKSIGHYLLGDARLLSIHKYASNVVEKCIEYGNEEDKKYLIEELLGDKNLDSTEENMSLYKMMDNKYGNYVVQKAIEQATQEQISILQSKIVSSKLQESLSSSYVKHVISGIERLSLLSTETNSITLSISVMNKEN